MGFPITSNLEPKEPILELGLDDIIPQNERPVRPEVSNDPALAEEYESQRKLLMDNSELKQLLIQNEKITGFCNLPEAIVKLEIDPLKAKTLWRRQYPVAQTMIAAVDRDIIRWEATGKIAQAPAGCEYNLPLYPTAKKDEQGNLKGVRTCYDSRPLNKALIMGDRYQIPNIRKSFDQFGGCKMFGEFDLSEAYLQFPMHPDSRKYVAFTWNLQQYVFLDIQRF
jgi:hypothetical protein